MTKKPKILVVGSFVMDTITSTEIFPQSGQTVLGYQYTTAPGGKGANQAMGAALLGADVTMVGKVGRDTFGDKMIESQKSAGVNVSHVLRAEEGVSSGIGNVMITTKDGVALNNRIIVIPGANMQIKKEEVAFLEDMISSFDMVILQFEIPMEINEQVARYAHRAKVPVMVNPAPIAPIPRGLMECASYLSPNETEAAGLLGCVVREEGGQVTEKAVADIRTAMAEKGLERLLITLGDEGAMSIGQEDMTHRPCVQGIKVVDPTAAGDSFVAAFCTARCIGMEDSEAMDFANMIAAVTVSGMGAQPSLPTLEKAIAFHEAEGRDVSVLKKAKEQLG